MGCVQSLSFPMFFTGSLYLVRSGCARLRPEMDLQEFENAPLQLCQAMCSENSNFTSWLDTAKSMDTFGFKHHVSQNA